VPESVAWGAGIKDRLVEYITTDMTRSLADRATLERKWARWLEQYRAPTTTEVKQFPWVGASNRTLPWTAMNADPLIAKFMTTLHAPDAFWTLQPLNERWVNASKPMQDYLQYLDETSSTCTT
jgi:hypothetical protein